MSVLMITYEEQDVICWYKGGNLMNTDRSWRCPYCGCTELLEGYQRSDGMMMPRKFTMGIVGSIVQHYFFKNCGTIVYSRVIDTKPFRPAGRTES